MSYLSGSTTDSVLAAVRPERERQDRTWGLDRHELDHTWIVLIVEELGEMCQSIDGFAPPGHDMKSEAIQAAALLCQMIQDLESQGR